MNDSHRTYTLILLIRDCPGVLIRSAQIMERRGHAIREAHVKRSTNHTYMHITALGSPMTVPQIILQLQKLIDVVDVKRGEAE